MGPYDSDFFFVTKPNGGLRDVCDFRGVNLITKKILPTLPLFENVVSQLEGAKFFSGLDLTSMFYQLRIREEDIEKTPFRIQQIVVNVSPSGFTFTAIVTNIISVFVPKRSRVVQTHFFSFYTARDRPGTKTEIRCSLFY